MANLSPAEIMLDSLVPAQRLIRRLQGALKAPVPFVGVGPSQVTKANIAALRGNLQAYIDELTAQREKAAALVNLIPDQTSRTVIQLRYGLVGSEGQKVPWIDMEELMNYGRHSIFRYHRKGVDQLNQLLENGG